jgi:EAL and modified HD-GYP domain-containing signal transduction protein
VSTAMDNLLLGQVALSYCPITDRQRNVTATRLTIFPLNPSQALNAGALLSAVSSVWPAGGPKVALSVRSESLLADLLATRPTDNIMIEVPAFMAVDPVHTQAIGTLYAKGNTLLLAGRPNQPLPRELLPCFKYSIIDLSDDRRIDETGVSGVPRSIGFYQDGVRTVADMEASFRRGAVAVLGWPIDDAMRASSSNAKKGARPDLQVLVELINRIDREEPIDRLEATLKRDPTLAFRLMRYINSPAFGMSVEISSFSHAVMLLGYQRLKRWLALLLATASKDANLRPVMFAAVRRGMLMEALAGREASETVRSEMFICGVFSLLDRMFQEPFSDLLKTIPVPEGVYLALAEESGPYEPFVKLTRAVENGPVLDIREAQETAMVKMSEVNRALLTALGSAAQID